MNNWKEKVYHEPLEVEPPSWKEVRKECLRRDNHTCQGCEFRGPGTLNHHLTVHHMYPRSMGGDERQSNLMCLCNHCHDVVEIGIGDGKQLFNRPTIMDFLDEYYHGDTEVVDERLLSDDIKDWKKWVYGGYRRPRRRRKKTSIGNLYR